MNTQQALIAIGYLVSFPLLTLVACLIADRVIYGNWIWNRRNR